MVSPHFFPAIFEYLSQLLCRCPAADFVFIVYIVPFFGTMSIRFYGILIYNVIMDCMVLFFVCAWAGYSEILCRKNDGKKNENRIDYKD
jgi:hypothetical protein